jgi:hypothetical protein
MIFPCLLPKKSSLMLFFRQAIESVLNTYVRYVQSRGIIMAKCPTCGKDVKTAKKTWKMAGKPDKKGKRTQLTIALYDCCGKTFREVLDKKKI